MTLSVVGESGTKAAADALADRLRSHPEVAWVELADATRASRALFDLYFDRRVYFASERPAEEIPAWFEEDALARRAAVLRAELAGPGGPLLARIAESDPMGLFERHLARLEGYRRGEAATGATSSATTLQLGLRSSPFDAETQTPLLEFIEAEFAAIRAGLAGPLGPGPDLGLEQSGVNRFAVETERRVRRDLNRISTLSLLAVASLFLLVFRSLRSLALAIAIPLGGFGCALAATALAGEAVHGITLGFGFVLVGVAIDYPIHVMHHRALSDGTAAAADTARRLRPSLLASAATTTLAFLSLILSDFPGLSEMGRFAGVGVPVCLGLTLFALPAFLPGRSVATPTQTWAAHHFARGVRGLRAHPVLAAAPLTIPVLLAVFGVPRLAWEDDPATLMAVDRSLHTESERVRRRVADFDGGRFVVGLAPTREAALELNAAIDRRLEGAMTRGALDARGSLHTFLWPESLQRANLETLRATPDLRERLTRAFAAEDFRETAFDPFFEDLTHPKVPPLRAADLAASPLARALDSLVEMDEGVAVLTYVRGVHDGSAVAAALSDLDEVHYVDQRDILGRVYAGYRRSAVRTVAFGAVIVLAVLWLRYRSLRHALLAFAPAALACCGTLGVLGLSAAPVNVASAVSLLVVLGMGVDYGIFAVDAARRGGEGGTTLSALAISCLTSVFVFGVLALSEQPVLRAVGTVTGIGVLLALTLSPPVVALAAPRGRA